MLTTTRHEADIAGAPEFKFVVDLPLTDKSRLSRECGNRSQPRWAPQQVNRFREQCIVQERMFHVEKLPDSLESLPPEWHS